MEQPNRKDDQLMIQAMRRNVLIDCGKTENQLGAVLIETPDIYKRIPNKGTIVSVGSKCRLLNQSHVGMQCIIDNHRHEVDRIPPDLAKKCGMDDHWYFNIHEDKITCIPA